MRKAARVTGNHGLAPCPDTGGITGHTTIVKINAISDRVVVAARRLAATRPAGGGGQPRSP